MGMNVGSSSSESDPIVDVNTTPLIDLMLVLIVMLIMTLPPQTHAVKLDLPVLPGDPPPVPPTVIDIVIDFDNTIYWDGNKVESAQTLQNYLRFEGQRIPKSEVHLRPNKLAKYDAVAKVLATAKRLGVNNIGIMGNEALD
jgi:biopolymer transport protein ExbD